MIVALLALLTACTTVHTTGSVYREKCTHVGVRPSKDRDGTAVTVQITTDWPICSETKRNEN